MSYFTSNNKSKYIVILSVFISFVILSIYLVISFGSSSNALPKKASNIRDLMAQNHRYVGTAIQSGYIDYKSNNKHSDTLQYRNTLIHNFTSVTPEYETKWDQIEPERNVYNFTPSDIMLHTAMKRGQLFRGHTLVWHNQVPQWALSEAGDYRKLLDDLYSFITVTVQHFAGKVYSWDVVNEVIDDNPNNANQYHLRDSIFATASENVYGNRLEYIKKAFEIVHQNDPKSYLYANDYRVEGYSPTSSDMQIKSDNYYEMIKALKESGIPINGVGFQTHVDADGGVLPSNFQETLIKFSKLNVNVAVTELTDNNSNTQATNYKKVFQICLNVPKCVGVTFWGFTDLHVNAANTGIFDVYYKPKESYYSILSLVN